MKSTRVPTILFLIPFLILSNNISLSAQMDSKEATLSVKGKSIILKQPEDIVSYTGPDYSVTFSVLVIGSPPIEYQWQHNRKNMEGENYKELEIDSVTSYDAGSYRCYIRNDSGEELGALQSTAQTILDESLSDSRIITHDGTC